MQKKPYCLKWALTYKEKPYIEVYGKKKAHDLAYMLSFCVLGLKVEPIQPVKRQPNEARKKVNEYYKKWREQNKEKVKEYQERYRKRKEEYEQTFLVSSTQLLKRK